MPTSKSSQQAVNRYIKANYDQLQLRMPKGYKQVIQQHAVNTGESVNGLINRAIKETIARDTVDHN